MRWLHSVAAVVWIGAVVVELLVLGRPAPGVRTSTGVAKTDPMLEIVQTSLAVFLMSGAILTFDRLSRGAATPGYVGLLAVKLVLSVAMAQVAFRFGRATGPTRVLGLRIVAGLGMLILFTASLLKTIYERALLS